MSGWRPLFEGAEGQEALDVVLRIARDLARSEPDTGGLLDGGSAGQAAFFGYLARALGDTAHLDRAFEQLERAAAVADQMPLALHDGLAGVGWAIRHLQPGETEEDDLDGGILTFLARTPLPYQPADLLYGDLGLAVYALERGAAGRAALARITERLAATALRDAHGVFWRVYAGYVNGGVPHGVPGVVAGLAPVAGAEELVSGAAAWLCAHRLPDGCFPGAVRDQPETPVRHGWCYGDPGVAAALYRAGRLDPDWRGIALERARFVGGLDLAGARLHDASLCHGAAGVAHILNRFHQDSGDAALGEAARAWFRRAIGMAKEGQGIGGYLFARENDERVADPSVLTGAAGVGLALLAAATPVAPDWDRILLLSAPE
ncbi:MAG TPA: lanthionine synthetase C family protein [Kofleriaceae bacterium]|nr:lanthionine synthetase C family protein [Kofleriaceae bacterium]